MEHSTRQVIVAGLFFAGLFPAASRAQDQAPAALEPVVVAATRIPESELTVGSDVDLASGADLERQQLATLADALSGTPAAPAFATGQAGAAASLLLRGSASDQTLFLVDGIRMNDQNTSYGPFLGGARLFPTDTVEVDKGPQSALYGSDAAGGIVSLSTAKGSGSPTGSLSAEAGTFGTLDGTAAAQGSGGVWAYNLGLSGETTDNARPYNRFESGDLAARLDVQLLQYLTGGITVRGFVSRYADPGDDYGDQAFEIETESNWLGTLFLDAKLTEYISSKLTLGGQDRIYDTAQPWPGRPTAETTVENRRGIVDWQNVMELTSSNRLVAGLTAEEDTTFDDGFGDIDRRQSLLGLYTEDEWTLPDHLTITGGSRLDDYDTFGSATTGRLTAAWLPFGQTLKLRGSYGTGFDAPSFLDLVGKSSAYVGNPNLLPERSSGWDVGADLFAATGEKLDVTWFEADYTNLIEYDFNAFPSTVENIGQATTKGLELSYQARVAGILRAKLAYTRLFGEDLTTNAPLLWRPHYTASADLWAPIGRGFSLGAGASWVGIRADVDPLTYATIDDPAYPVIRFYGAWKLTQRLTLKARIENALNRRYDPVAGYPAAGSAVFGGASYSF